jgi:HlyD family secretion protein
MVLVVVVVAGCDHGRGTIERKPSTTPVAESSADAIVPGRVVAPGIVEPWDGEIRVSTKESGWISEILVKEGEHVEAGQVLARLDAEVQRQEVALAETSLAEAEAELAKLSRGATREERLVATANYDVARTQAVLAESENVRAEQLHAQGALAQAELDRMRTMAEAQAAAARAAEAQRVAVKKGARTEDRAIARQRVAAAGARLEQARMAVGRREIVAPRAGTILVSRFHVGEFYVVGTAPLFILGDMSLLQIRLEVDEIDSPRVVVGAPCDVFSDDGVKLGEGTIHRAAPKMGRRGLFAETPTERNDVRVREVFVEVPGTVPVVPGQRVWGHTSEPSS